MNFVFLLQVLNNAKMFMTNARTLLTLVMVSQIFEQGEAKTKEKEHQYQPHYRIVYARVRENSPVGTFVQCVLSKREKVKNISPGFPSTFSQSTREENKYPLSYEGVFEIDPQGCIKVAGTVDREIQEYYFIHIITLNHTSKPSVVVRIMVLDENDNAPVWNVNKTEFQIPEDAQPFIINVGYANDPDSELYHFNTRMYQIVEESGESIYYFDVFSQFDYKRQRLECFLKVRGLVADSERRIVIRALDGGYPRLYNDQSFDIKITPPRMGDLSASKSSAMSLYFRSLNLGEIVSAIVVLKSFIG